MTERIDEVEKYYKPIRTCESLIFWLFGISAILSIGMPYTTLIATKWLKQVLEISFIIAVVIHFILSQYNRFHLIPVAERKRRKQLLSDAFKVPLTSETTSGYYNNPLMPSITRLGVNLLENSFFAKNVCQRMVIRERTKVLGYAVIWLIAMLCRSTNLEFILMLTQIIFSGEIFIKWLSMGSPQETEYNPR